MPSVCLPQASYLEGTLKQPLPHNATTTIWNMLITCPTLICLKWFDKIKNKHFPQVVVIHHSRKNLSITCQIHGGRLPVTSRVSTTITLRPFHRQGVLTPFGPPEVMIFHAWPSDSPGGRGEKAKDVQFSWNESPGMLQAAIEHSSTGPWLVVWCREKKLPNYMGIFS